MPTLTDPAVAAPDWSLARTDEPTNAKILAVSEDRLAGFQEDPFGEIARLSGVPVDTVLETLRFLLEAGTVRRIRQTLLATNLASGALVAWEVSPTDLEAGFTYLSERDPFSGHVVIRSTDAETPGSRYRLWTTLKVPQGFSLPKHAAFLQEKIGAKSFRLMPAKAFFVLGVGHVRRRGLEPGSKDDVPAVMQTAEIVRLSQLEWRVLSALKREFEINEIVRDVWAGRIAEAGVDRETFFSTARSLASRGVIGRFSTFLEHVKPTLADERVTRYNALFHWRVPVGREQDAGREVGRFHCMTHAYWREGGPEFAGVNIMGVAHGQEKPAVLAHKAAIDAHLNAIGIPVLYTNVFWGGRSEIKPSEIVPFAYEQFCRDNGIDPDAMRDMESEVTTP
jgi:hypothetical protein